VHSKPTLPHFFEALLDSTVVLKGAASKELFENLSDLPGVYTHAGDH